MLRSANLDVVSSTDSALHRTGDRLMTAQEISNEIFRGHVSPEWVRRNLPKKIDLGHSTKAWWESDVIEYIESRKDLGFHHQLKGVTE